MGVNLTQCRTAGNLRVVDDDVAGAIGEAVTSWMEDMISGPGQIAYGITITCGEVAGSVGKAANQLIYR